MIKNICDKNKKYSCQYIKNDKFENIINAVEHADSDTIINENIACISKAGIIYENKELIKYKNKLALKKPAIKTDFQYPAIKSVSSGINFEEYFCCNFVSNNLPLINKYEYLPIFWTGCLEQHNSLPEQEKHDSLLKGIDNYIKKLDPDKKYFTICQSQILNDFKNLDVTVFSMSSNNISGKNVKIIKIPLLAEPLPEHNLTKNILASYVGLMNLPVCIKMFDMYHRNIDYHFLNTKPGIDEYSILLSRSIFSLCPVNYNENTFRIQESLQHKAIPVVITEHLPFLPYFYDENKPFMLFTTPEKMEIVIGSVFKNQQFKNELIENGKLYYNKYYNYDNLALAIIKYLHIN
jgi:hypothetical protein